MIVEFGCDIARFGQDSTVIAIRKGLAVLPLVVLKKKDTMEVTGKIIELARQHKPQAIKVDDIGVGGGVTDRLKEQSYPVVPINVAEAPRDPEKFADLRSELWWMLRERLDPNPKTNPTPIALPKDDELLGDLCGIKYKITSKGQIRVESKEDMKKRIKRSPDRGDAVVLAFASVVPKFFIGRA